MFFFLGQQIVSNMNAIRSKSKIHAFWRSILKNSEKIDIYCDYCKKVKQFLWRKQLRSIVQNTVTENYSNYAKGTSTGMNAQPM